MTKRRPKAQAGRYAFKFGGSFFPICLSTTRRIREPRTGQVGESTAGGVVPGEAAALREGVGGGHPGGREVAAGDRSHCQRVPRRWRESKYPVPPRREHSMLPAPEPQRESPASPECPALPPEKENLTPQLLPESSAPQRKCPTLPVRARRAAASERLHSDTSERVPIACATRESTSCHQSPRQRAQRRQSPRERDTRCQSPRERAPHRQRPRERAQ
ncbi:hypothetical protein EOD39_8528 [Acipenser ruthenus]|uniref:Uncharacterized protein n=1 Tax=Acipenser ruthenus TaxID=7906 RepID=A0A444U3L5_ACIRT|nr:hypothetical protein EOD39_8528 [Acipenser ruthenus]